MLSVFTRNPACCCLMRVGRGAEPGFVCVRNTAREDEIELVLEFGPARLFPIYFSDMQQFCHENIHPDFFPALSFEGCDEVFSGFLFSTGQGEVSAFHRVLFFLNQ